MIVVSFDIGIKNLAYSIINFNCQERRNNEDKYDILKLIRLQEWHKIDLQSSKYDLETISNNLLEVLDNIVYNQIDLDNIIKNNNVHIVIENQPALKSPTMKSIQIVIYTYFKTLCKYMSLPMTIKLISAKSKLKYIESFNEFAQYMNEEQNIFQELQQTSKMKRIPKEKQGYAKNKDDSVQFTKWLFNTILDDETHKQELNNIKKKDDVCDSLLQGLFYINRLSLN
jgi:Mitochondrial resolvase Ydc2 / RNA splicing MRS1